MMTFIKNFKIYLSELLPKVWYHNYLKLGYFLYPFSLIYLLVITFRRFCYRKGFKKTTHFGVPVIVVGNITVGGTGKTPLVIWLTEFFQKKGLRVGIISRGYRADLQSKKPILVTKTSDVRQVGDEPFLLTQRLSVPIMVCSNRVLAVQTLLKKQSCDVIISDDGLQHYALGRDLEIAVVDGKRRFGNQFCLPAGPLREPITRLKTVDFVVYNGRDQGSRIKDQGCRDALHASKDLGSRIQNAVFQMILKPDLELVSVKNFKNRLSIEEILQKKVLALAGIGHPERFFNSLKKIGFSRLSCLPFPDHYLFTSEDIDQKNYDFIIMTEKDAVKCRGFADDRHWFLRVSADIDPIFGEKIIHQI